MKQYENEQTCGIINEVINGNVMMNKMIPHENTSMLLKHMKYSTVKENGIGDLYPEVKRKKDRSVYFLQIIPSSPGWSHEGIGR